MNLFKNNELGSSGRRNFFVFSGIFLIIIILVGGGYAVWNRYFSSEAQTQRNYQKYVDWQANYDKAMREDTYGGKTPQETLDMFVAALEKGDMELASKYFMLDTNENSENYLTRKKWEDGLLATQNLNKIKETIELLKNAYRDESLAVSDSDTQFKLIKDGATKGRVYMKLNEYSNVWKIESL